LKARMGSCFSGTREKRQAIEMKWDTRAGGYTDRSNKRDVVEQPHVFGKVPLWVRQENTKGPRPGFLKSHEIGKELS